MTPRLTCALEFHLFQVGVAESGAHNRTLTPFGFQSERRTIWQAPEVYLKCRRSCMPIKLRPPRGNGGTVRLVFLPFEAHGYRAREGSVPRR